MLLSKDQVHPSAVCLGLDDLGEVLGRVVDGLVGAELPGQRELVVGGGRGEDAGAEEPGELDRRGADPGRCRVDQDGFAGRQPAELPEHVQCREVVDGERGGLDR